MSKFKVIEGTHVEDGVEYKKGDVVTSSRNLDKLFSGKFTVVAAAPAPAKDEAETTQPPPAKPKKEKPARRTEDLEG